MGTIKNLFVRIINAVFWTLTVLSFFLAMFFGIVMENLDYYLYFAFPTIVFATIALFTEARKVL